MGPHLADPDVDRQTDVDAVTGAECSICGRTSCQHLVAPSSGVVSFTPQPKSSFVTEPADPTGRYANAGDELRSKVLNTAVPGKACVITKDELAVFMREATSWREFVKPATTMAFIRQGVVGWIELEPGNTATRFTVMCPDLIRPDELGATTSSSAEDRDRIIEDLKDLIRRNQAKSQPNKP